MKCSNNKVQMINNTFDYIQTVKVKSKGKDFNPIQDGLFRGYSRIERGSKKAPLPKICQTYPTMMKIGTAIPYPKKIQKIYESCDTPLEF